MEAADGRPPAYAQLYILDPSAANTYRLERPENHGCLAEIISTLDRIMREISPYAEAFRMLAEVEREERRKAAVDQRPARSVCMSLQRDSELDQRRYNLPTSNEVAMVFLEGVDGEPPFERDVRIYPKTPNGATSFV